jgi:hypothetical protein
MIQATQEWGFTDIPDFTRICRELGESGCALGLVESRGLGAITFVDFNARVWPQRALQLEPSLRVPGAPGWHGYRGDHVKKFLGAIQVRVKGYR